MDGDGALPRNVARKSSASKGKKLKRLNHKKLKSLNSNVNSVKTNLKPSINPALNQSIRDLTELHDFLISKDDASSNNKRIVKPTKYADFITNDKTKKSKLKQDENKTKKTNDMCCEILNESNTMSSSKKRKNTDISFRKNKNRLRTSAPSNINEQVNKPKRLYADDLLVKESMLNIIDTTDKSSNITSTSTSGPRLTRSSLTSIIPQSQTKNLNQSVVIQNSLKQHPEFSHINFEPFVLLEPLQTHVSQVATNDLDAYIYDETIKPFDPNVIEAIKTEADDFYCMEPDEFNIKTEELSPSPPASDISELFSPIRDCQIHLERISTFVASKDTDKQTSIESIEKVSEVEVESSTVPEKPKKHKIPVTLHDVEVEKISEVKSTKLPEKLNEIKSSIVPKKPKKHKISVTPHAAEVNKSPKARKKTKKLGKNQIPEIHLLNSHAAEVIEEVIRSSVIETTEEKPETATKHENEYKNLKSLEQVTNTYTSTLFKINSPEINKHSLTKPQFKNKKLKKSPKKLETSHRNKSQTSVRSLQKATETPVKLKNLINSLKNAMNLPKNIQPSKTNSMFKNVNKPEKMETLKNEAFIVNKSPEKSQKPTEPLEKMATLINPHENAINSQPHQKITTFKNMNEPVFSDKSAETSGKSLQKRKKTPKKMDTLIKSPENQTPNNQLPQKKSTFKNIQKPVFGDKSPETSIRSLQKEAKPPEKLDTVINSDENAINSNQNNQPPQKISTFKNINKPVFSNKSPEKVKTSVRSLQKRTKSPEKQTKMPPNNQPPQKNSTFKNIQKPVFSDKSPEAKPPEKMDTLINSHENAINSNQNNQPPQNISTFKSINKPVISNKSPEKVETSSRSLQKRTKSPSKVDTLIKSPESPTKMSHQLPQKNSTLKKINKPVLGDKSPETSIRSLQKIDTLTKSPEKATKMPQNNQQSQKISTFKNINKPVFSDKSSEKVKTLVVNKFPENDETSKTFVRSHQKVFKIPEKQDTLINPLVVNKSPDKVETPVRSLEKATKSPEKLNTLTNSLEYEINSPQNTLLSTKFGDKPDISCLDMNASNVMLTVQLNVESNETSSVMKPKGDFDLRQKLLEKRKSDTNKYANLLIQTCGDSSRIVLANNKNLPQKTLKISPNKSTLIQIQRSPIHENIKKLCNSKILDESSSDVAESPKILFNFDGKTLVRSNNQEFRLSDTVTEKLNKIYCDRQNNETISIPNSPASDTDSYVFAKPKHTFKFIEKCEVKRPPSRKPGKITLNRPKLDPEPSQTCSQAVFKAPMPMKKPEMKKTHFEPNKAIDDDVISILADTSGMESVCDATSIKDESSSSEDEIDCMSNETYMDINRLNQVNDWLSHSIDSPIPTTSEILSPPTKKQTEIPIARVHPGIQKSNSIEGSNEESSDERINIKTNSLRPENNIFKNICYQFFRNDYCPRGIKCFYMHSLPLNWEYNLKQYPIDDLLRSLTFVKSINITFLYKKILPVVASQLGLFKDFNNLTNLVRDVLQINMNTDREPLIKDIIQALIDNGFSFHSAVEIVFRSATVAENLKNLLCDILLNLTVERKQMEDDWPIIQMLSVYKMFDIDKGIIHFIIGEAVAKNYLQKEMIHKVYNDLIRRIPDHNVLKFSPTHCQRFVRKMLKYGLQADADEFMAKLVSMNILEKPPCLKVEVQQNEPPPIAIDQQATTTQIFEYPRPLMSIPHFKQYRNNYQQQNVKNYSLPSPALRVVDQSTKDQFFRNPQPSTSSSFSPLCYSTENLHLLANAATQNLPDLGFLGCDVKPDTQQYAAQPPHPPKPPASILYNFSEVKQLVREENFVAIMQLIVKHKEGLLTDPFLDTLIAALIETPHNYPTFYSSINEMAALSNDVELNYMMKTIGVNLVLHLCQNGQYDPAFRINYILTSKCKNSDLYDVYNCKVCLKNKHIYTYFRRMLIIAQMYLIKADIQTAWNILRDNALSSGSYWQNNNNEADLKYRDIVLANLFESLKKIKNSHIALDVLIYLMKYKSNDINIREHSNSILVNAINNKCSFTKIEELMNVSPEWYHHLNNNTIRSILVIACLENKDCISKLYEIALKLRICPQLTGNEKTITFNGHYHYAELQLYLDKFLQNMVNYQPINHVIIINFTLNDEPDDEIPLLHQYNLSKNVLATRVTNILENVMKPPIKVVNRNNFLYLVPESVNAHLLHRQL